MAARDDEPRARKKVPASSVRPVQEEEEEDGAEGAAMSGAGTGAAVAVPVGAACYSCGGMPAVVYCRADAAGLCLPCDRHVHGANTVSSRHARAPLCAACRAAPASFRRGGAARFLCSDCDFEELMEPPPPLHERGTVEGYTGCPTVGELAAILGVHGCDEKAAADSFDDEGCWSFWEEPQVLSLDDVIVPTTSCHGLKPLLTSSSSSPSPKNRSSPCGEVLRQLGELAKSEAAAYVEAEPAGDQLPPWASSEYATGHGDLGALGTEAGYEVAASMAVPSCEHQALWIATDCGDPPDARDAEASREQVPASSPAEPSLSSFVEISDIVYPSMSRSGINVNGSHDHPSPMAVAMPAQAQPKNGGYDIAYPDRGTVISRYKEKRKNRRFGKQIRYESRKARADGRLRIKGRFARSG